MVDGRFLTSFGTTGVLGTTEVVPFEAPLSERARFARWTDECVRPYVNRLGGLACFGGYWWVLGSGPGIAHAVDYRDGA